MDYYEILGVNRTASDQEIKEAYRKLVKQFHPDKNKSEEATHTIRSINEAYEVLSDPVKRSQYDQHGFIASTVVYEEDPREVYRREYIRKKFEENRKEREKKERYDITFFELSAS